MHRYPSELYIIVVGHKSKSRKQPPHPAITTEPLYTLCVPSSQFIGSVISTPKCGEYDNCKSAVAAMGDSCDNGADCITATKKATVAGSVSPFTARRWSDVGPTEGRNEVPVLVIRCFIVAEGGGDAYM
jgi:hypothetical protein